MSAAQDDFPDFLAQKLPVGVTLRVYHVYTPAATCTSIFAAASDQKEEATTCESHFLAISQQHATAPDDTSTLSSGPTLWYPVKEEVLVFGIEVLTFNTPSLTTIFVSKADSTGFLDRPTTSTSAGTLQGSSSIIRNVTSTFLEWLVSRRLDPHNQDFNSTTESSNNLNQAESEGLNGQDIASALPQPPQNDGTHHEDEKIAIKRPDRKRLVLSLFARSQNQYLFPGSIENTTKHVLDDRQLIKWWCRVLDGLLQKDWNIENPNQNTNIPRLLKTDSGLGFTTTETKTSLQSPYTTVSPSGFLIVPGCDRYETIRLFLPPSTRSSTPDISSRWSVSYPAEQLNRLTSTGGSPAPVRCMIPRLPDDPKARFCDDLDDSGLDDQKNWKSIKTLDQFWEMMSYRQECSAGRLVGFAWVVFDQPCHNRIKENGHSANIASTKAQTKQQQDDTLAYTLNYTHTDNSSEAMTSTTVLENNNTPNLALSDTQQPTSNQTAVALSSEDYNKLADYLINTTDFAGIDMAKKSTQGWIARVKELSNSTNFGATVHGKATLPTGNTTTEAFHKPDIPKPQDAALLATSASGDTNMNILIGVRKRKRKVEMDDNRNVLPQPKDDAGTSTTETLAERPNRSDQVNDQDGAITLPAALVRKKPKSAAS